MRRCAGVSAAQALPLANSTSGRGHRLTFAVRYLPALSYSPNWIPLICCSIPPSPATGASDPNQTGLAARARIVASATRDCWVPILSPA